MFVRRREKKVQRGLGGVKKSRGYFRRRFLRERGSFRGTGERRRPFYSSNRFSDSLGGVRLEQPLKLGDESNWIQWITEDSPKVSLQHRIKGDENYGKMKHLFVELENDCCPKKLKVFCDKTLPEAMRIIAGVKRYVHSSTKERSEGKEEYELFEQEIKNRLPPLSLKESINAAKYRVIKLIPFYNLRSIRDDAFPRTICSIPLLLKNEMKRLTGVMPTHYGYDLLNILSNTGHCIVDVLVAQSYLDLYIKAADYFIQRPKKCPKLEILV